MEIDFGEMTSSEVYRLLTGIVVPRPIALVTTLDRQGVVNAAPFSFFNLMGSDPPIVALGVGNRSRYEAKDTARNIRDVGEFVVNLVDEALSEKMNLCAVDFPPELSEVEVVGLAVAPSVKVAPPRLLSAPFSLECRHASTVEIGRNRVILGEIVYAHARPELVDRASARAMTERAGLIGRMHGGGHYVRTTDLFEIPRISYEIWLEQFGER